MFAKRIIPCLDIKDGRVVKGVNFVGLRDAGDPVEVAAARSPWSSRATAPTVPESEFGDSGGWCRHSRQSFSCSPVTKYSGKTNSSPV